MSERPPLEVPQGRFPLALPHSSPRSPLQAWDAADQYLLREVAARTQTLETDSAPLTVWVFEDHYGALSVPLLLSDDRVMVRQVADPLCAPEWTLENLRRCASEWGRELELDRLEARLSLTSLPTLARAPLSEPVDRPQVALIKVGPQLSVTTSALRYLSHIKNLTWVLGGGMVKHVHTSTVKAFEAHLGPSPTSLAWKKARLITPELSAQRPEASPAQVSRYRLDPQTWETIDERAQALLSSLVIQNSEGTFSEGQLDQGARAMIPHLSGALREAAERRALAGETLSQEAPLRVADLGCGDGVLSWVLIACAEALGIPLHVTCLDLSAAALESARLTYEGWRAQLIARHTDLLTSEVRFLGGDALAPWRATQTASSYALDLIVNNPPFHQRGATTSSISERMFSESRRALAQHGALWVVGNRHLGYHQHLRRNFQRVEVRSEHPKFVVICATGPRLNSSSSGRIHTNKGPRRRRG